MDKKEESVRELPVARIRMPSSLREMVVNSAKINRRSMNAEIVARLEQSFRTVEKVVIDDGSGMSQYTNVTIGPEDAAVLERLLGKIKGSN